jgi:CubicO group peptidase (beta-lactamase class C family)
VKIRNLVSNDSGRFWSFESDYITGLVASLDQTDYAIGLSQQFDPGTTWEYNNSAIQTLEEVLAHATGQDVGSYAQTELFTPIGATAAVHSDPAGNPLVYQGVSASCDDMARFGYLALRDGKWKDQQIIPQQWVQQSTQPSTELNTAYGYMWWLNREGHVVQPSFPVRNEYDGQLVPGASPQLMAAVGAFGQLIIIDPASETVVVRLQNITDLNAALATSPDPTGFTQLREIATAFEAAKKKKKKTGT